MPETQNLYGIIKEKAYDYGIIKPEIPVYIKDNLKHEFFEWQNEAFQNFLTNEAIRERENTIDACHLMFNMATGTGKTLLMAASILYYYKQGYRHFIFFVNQNNIVDKTENNFIDSTHTKYLFKEKIIIDDNTVTIKKVNTFSENPQGIEIKFTTIQKLYNDIHIERENQTTLDDLHKLNLVMLADEAHHLNAETKNKNGTQEELDLTEITNRTGVTEIERKGWEHTVIELILNKNGKKGINKNVLLEFTATIPANEQVAEKYKDKIIYKFGLKEFLAAGYTKEINLISSTLDKKERVLQALLFHWYRHKVALKNGISNFKPVILFRSKFIEDSKEDYEEFINLTDNISAVDFNFLNEISERISQSKDLYEQGKSRTEQVLNFIKQEKISYSEIADFIKNNFSANNIIITNSETNKTKTEKTTEEQEKLLNSLEDKNNYIRAIFTVNRLTEGWDVLNLYDIVRLYEGQNAGGGAKKTPEATIKEKQLIGRGVRYFPFAYKDKIKNKRKFDEDLQNEMRILEELFYYTFDEESRYISHLKNELKKDGYIRDDKVVKTFRIRKEFHESDFYKNTKVWYNKQIDNPNRKMKSLKDLRKDFFVPYKIKSLELAEEGVGFIEQDDLQNLSIQTDKYQTITIKFNEIEKHIFRKAVNIKAKSENSLAQFEQLHNILLINSLDELQQKLFCDFTIRIILNASKEIVEKSDLDIYTELIDNNDKLTIVLKFLEKLFFELQNAFNPKIGDDFIAGNFEQFFSEPKTKTIKEDSDSDRIAKELEKENWYVLDSFYGTSEEKELIAFIKSTIGNLESKYEQYYLLRNEEVYKIYDFEKGRGFQPDFILFLRGKKPDNLYYQIFIEPKQLNYMTSENEIWKEKFLEQISERYGLNKIIKAENPNYRLIGLPFFNAKFKSKFEATFEEILKP